MPAKRAIDGQPNPLRTTVDAYAERGPRMGMNSAPRAPRSGGNFGGGNGGGNFGGGAGGRGRPRNPNSGGYNR